MEKAEINKKVMKFFTYIFYMIISIIIGVGIYLRCKIYLTSTSVGWDEMQLAFNFLDLKRNMIYLFRPLDVWQKIPPLWGCNVFLILKIFGIKCVTLRFLSIIPSVLSLFAFFYLLLDMVKNKWAIIAGMLIFATNLPLIYYANEFHPYSSDVLICLLLIMAYKHIHLKGMTNKQLLIYSIITFILVLYSFPTMFIISGIILAKYVEERHITYKVLVLPLIIAANGFYLYITDLDCYNYMNKFWIDGNGFITVKTVGRIIYNFFDYYNWSETKYGLVIFVVLTVIGMFVSLFKKRKEGLLFLFIILLTLIASFIKAYPFQQRHILFLIPIFTIYMLQVFDLTRIKNKVTGEIMSLILFLLIISISGIKENIIQYTTTDMELMPLLDKRQNIEAVSTYLVKNSMEGEKVIFYYFYRYSIPLYSKIYKKSYDIELTQEINDNTTEEEFKKITDDIIKSGRETGFWIAGIHDERAIVENKLQRLKIKYDVFEQGTSFCIHVSGK